MSEIRNDESSESQANHLCKSCGLCCTGHLFIWAKLRPGEMDRAEALGLHVFRSDPRQRGFSQPCPLWQGSCTIYGLPHYPRVCRAYRCKLLKETIAENLSLSQALKVVEQVKAAIRDVETLLPASSTPNFRERLVAQLERLERLPVSAGQDNTELEFREKAGELLNLYEKVFGVIDVVDQPENGE